jgi:hypothetical protein
VAALAATAGSGSRHRGPPGPVAGRPVELLTEHIPALQQLTTALVERETITGDQVSALVRAASLAAASADREISRNPFSS